MEIRTIGIDLGKTVFHFVGVNARGEVVVRKKGSRTPPAWMMLPHLSDIQWQDRCVLGGSIELYPLAGLDYIEWQN
jgi:hypothetical protein